MFRPPWSLPALVVLSGPETRPPGGRLFETPGDRVASRLPEGARELFLSYLREPLVEAPVLARSLSVYLQQLQANRGKREFLDVALAHTVAAWCGALVAALGATGSEDVEPRLVQSRSRSDQRPNEA